MRRTIFESLETRQMLTATLPFNATYHGGPIIQHVQAETVYYGTGITADTATQLDGFVGYLVNSSFMDGLAEYGVGRGSFVKDDAKPANSPSPGAQLTYNEIETMVENEAAAGRLNEPGGDSNNTLYLVFLGPGVTVETSSGVLFGPNSTIGGYHDYFNDSQGNFYYYAVIGNAPFETMTFSASHEIAEAATDPEPNSAKEGWIDDALGQTDLGGEVGDLAEQYSQLKGVSIGGWTSTGTRTLPAWAVPDQFPNYWVQDMWSSQYQCLIPPCGGIVVPNGRGLDISVGATGTPWVIGTDSVGSARDHGIYYWDGANWINAGGGGVDIAVGGSDGLPWVVNSVQDIYRHDGHTWLQMPGKAYDISVGADGSVWAIGTNPVGAGNDHGVYRWNGTTWIDEGGGGVAIAVGPDGLPWLVNSNQDIYHFDGHSWLQMPGKAYDISVGADGSVWAIGTNAVGSGSDHGVYRWNGTTWIDEEGGGVGIAVDPSGNPWLVNSVHNIYHWVNGAWQLLATLTASVPPSFIVGPDQSVNENAGSQTVSAWATKISPGSDASVAFAVSNDTNPSLFSVAPSIDAATGTLTFTPAANATGSATIAVQLEGQTAVGNEVSSAPQTFTITVNPLHPPSFVVGPNESIDENSGPQIVAAWASQISSGSDSTVAFVTASDSNPSLFSVAPSIDATTGTLTFTPAANATGSATIGIELHGQTANGTQENSAAQTFTIAVNSVIAPSFAVGSNQIIGENAGTQTISGWATGISRGSDNTVSFVTTSDSNPFLFSIDPAINATTGTLTFTPGANAIGSAVIAVELQGQTPSGTQNNSAVETFTISVNPPVRTPPPPAANADTFVLGPRGSYNGAEATSVLANDTSADGQPENFVATIVTWTSHGSLTLNSDGSFSYTPDPTFQGIDRFTYQVSEGSVTGNTATVTLLSYHASLVDKLYHQVLHRSAEDSGPNAGLQYWTGRLDHGDKLDVVAQGIFNSPERLDPLVTQFYNKYLLRGTDPDGLAHWVADWQQTGDPQDVVDNILASEEFYDDAGKAFPQDSADPNLAFVTLLYNRVLNRDPEPAGLKYWTAQLDSGQMTRAQVAAGFYISHEQHVDLVDFLYGEYFDNPTPTPDEAAPYIAELDAGHTETYVELQMIDSTTYESTPPEPPVGAVGIAYQPH